MDRYAVYLDISPGYVVVDTLSETVVALYHDRRNAERAARRLNAPPLIGRVHAVTETQIILREEDASTCSTGGNHD